MTASFDPDRRPEDIGADSPASGEAKRQSIAGARGGPRQAQTRGKERQPPQSSGRRSKRHEHLPTARKSFSPEEDPSLQGRGGPSPEMITRSQQGIEPRSGSHSAHGERTEELGQQGPPDHSHTRAGRQRVPGQPNRPIPEGDDPQDYT